MSQNVKNIYILGYLGVPEGVFNDQTGPILHFLSLNPKYGKKMYNKGKK